MAQKCPGEMSRWNVWIPFNAEHLFSFNAECMDMSLLLLSDGHCIKTLSRSFDRSLDMGACSNYNNDDDISQ